MIAREVLLLAAGMRAQGFLVSWGGLRNLKLPDMGTQSVFKAEPAGRTQTVEGTWVCSDKSRVQLTGHEGFWVPWRHLQQCGWWNCGSAVARAGPQGLPGSPRPALSGCCRRGSWGEKKCNNSPCQSNLVFSKLLCANHLTEVMYRVDMEQLD